MSTPEISQIGLVGFFVGQEQKWWKRILPKKQMQKDKKGEKGCGYRWQLTGLCGVCLCAMVRDNCWLRNAVDGDG